MIDNGYELTFRSPKDQSPLIIEYDESSFAHAILLASETKSEYLSSVHVRRRSVNLNS